MKPERVDELYEHAHKIMALDYIALPQNLVALINSWREMREELERLREQNRAYAQHII
ncbi:hypothetical protein LCGC14_2997610, partial [marine sediment metagenome]